MKKFPIFLILFLTVLVSCSQNCDTIPNSFTSYSKAINIVKRSSFSIEDTVRTSKSSWIKNASFYSCDGKIGFLIITTKKEKYIFQNVPFYVWKNFKKADSFGIFYNQNIRGKYPLNIN